MSVQTDYYIPQLEKADAQISLQARTITDQRAEIEGLRQEIRWAVTAIDSGYSAQTVAEHLRRVLTGNYAYE